MKITVTRSSHPDYSFFVKAEFKGRARSSHLNDSDSVDVVIRSYREAAHRNGVAVELDDQR